MVATLKPLRLEDFELVRQWRNAQLNILRQKEPITEEQQAKYAVKYFEEAMYSEPPQLLYGYWLGNRMHGYGGLVHIDWQHDEAEVSFLMSPHRKNFLLDYTIDYLIFLKMLRGISREIGIKNWKSETFTESGDPTRDIHVLIGTSVLHADVERVGPKSLFMRCKA